MKVSVNIDVVSAMLLSLKCITCLCREKVRSLHNKSVGVCEQRTHRYCEINSCSRKPYLFRRVSTMIILFSQTTNFSWYFTLQLWPANDDVRFILQQVYGTDKQVGLHDCRCFRNGKALVDFSKERLAHEAGITSLIFVKDNQNNAWWVDIQHSTPH